MQTKTFSYDNSGKKWSSEFPKLDSPRTLVIVFGAKRYGENSESLQELRRAYPTSQIIGCSTSGEIAGDVVSDESLSVAVTRFKHTTLKSAAAKITDATQSHASGTQIASKLATTPGLRAVFVLSEGLLVNGSELIRGMNEVLDDSVVVTGGLAGDGDRFESTWVMWGGKVASGMVAAVGLYGDHIEISHGSKGGWDPFGPERRVTRSEGNVLFELDGKAALPLYKNYLGSDAAELPSSGLLFPLAIRESISSDKYLVRTLLAIDEEAQSMTFAGDIPEDWSAQLMKADFERLVEGAEEAAKMTGGAGNDAEQEQLAIAISCVGRRLVLGSRIEDEVEVVLDVLPPKTKMVGFYSYGELSPFTTGKCDLHNQTMTLTVLSESAAPLSRPKGKPPRSPSLAGPTPPPSPVVPTPVPAVPTPPPAVSPRPSVKLASSSSNAELSITQRKVGRVLMVSLHGTIGERFPQQEVASLLRGDVALDLGGIDRVTSFGVRAWLDMLSDSARSLASLYLLRCSTAVVAQLGMIRGFSGSARILSFAAPYLCRDCGNAFDEMLDVETHKEEISNRAPAEVVCPQCEKSAFFDDHPTQYLDFAAEHLEPLSSDERGILAASKEIHDDAPSGRVEKEVRGATTYITTHEQIGDEFSWERALEGVEGALVIDLQGSPMLNSVQSRHVASAILEAMPNIASLKMEGCSPGVVDLFAEHGFPAKASISSLFLSGACHACSAKRNCLLTAEQLENGSPYRACRQCSEALHFEDAKRVAKALPTNDQFPDHLAAKLRSSPARLVPFLALAIALTVGAVVTVLALKRPKSGKEEAPTLPVAKFVGEKDTVPSPLSQPVTAPTNMAQADKSELNESVELEPAWSEQRIQKTPEGFLIVGRSEGKRTANEAAAAARSSATQIFLEKISEELDGSRVSSVSVATGGPARGDAEEVVRAIYDRQVGDIAPLVRTQAVLKDGTDGVSVIAQFQVRPSEYDAVVEFYRSNQSWRGLKVVPIFPLLAPRMAPTNGLVQISYVKPKSPAFYRRLRANDVVLSVRGQPVTTPVGFLKLVRQGRGSRRAPVELSVQSGSLLRSVSFAD